MYAAEADALAGRGIRWRRVADAQAYADRLVGSAWFGSRWPHFGRAHIERRGSGATWSACAPVAWDHPGPEPTEAVLFLAPGQVGQTALLHELAHALAGPGDGHSPAFVDVQLELVRHEMGFFAFTDYREALAAHLPVVSS